MDELSLHILDIVQNSIKADATLVELIINENIDDNEYEITIKDNGKGMNELTLNQACDPFFTTRDTRKVGLGLSMFKMACDLTEGNLTIMSKEQVGTTIHAILKHDHIDRAPLGKIEDTICILVLNENGVDIYYEHYRNSKTFIFDTREVKQMLGDIPFSDYTILNWIKEYIRNGLENIFEEEQQ
jgi:hypothetical protein